MAVGPLTNPPDQRSALEKRLERAKKETMLKLDHFKAYSIAACLDSSWASEEVFASEEAV